jgi:hypothetical protein
MGGQREHAAWVVLGGALVGVVELGHRRAERTRVAADLVQRDQALVPVEGGVLDALGHHRRAHLLEADGELELIVAGDVARAAGRRRSATRRRRRGGRPPP